METRQKICAVLMVVWMIVIFAFSARPGDLSSEDSALVGRMVGQIVVPGFDDWSWEEQEAFAEKIDYPVRKTAHASEYAALAVLAAGAYIRRDRTSDGSGSRRSRDSGAPGGWKGSRMTVPWLTATAYAATDEFHQLFVPGRSGQIRDVLVDSAGAAAGLLILAVVWKWRLRRADAAGNREDGA